MPFPALPARALRLLGQLLIRCRIWIPLRAALDLVEMAQEWYDADDERLQRRVLSRIRKRFRGLPVEVDVKDGIVTLNGSAESWRQIVEIGHLAGKHLPGIRGVVNKLSSDDAPDTAAPKPARESAEMLADVDVAIIGAGVIGAAIARELAAYQLRIAVIEKAADVATGQTKANNGMIHPAINPSYGSLMQKLNLRGNQLYPALAETLGFAIKRAGMLAVVTSADEAPLLEAAYIKSRLNGEDHVRLLSEAELRALEPNIKGEVFGALLCDNAFIVRPWEVALAFAENAAENGVRFFFNSEVLGFTKEDGRLSGVRTSSGLVRARLVINAAGVQADKVASLAGAEEFTLHPRRGEVVVFDRDVDGYVSNIVGELTLKRRGDSKGGAVMLTVDGNIMFGPSAEEVPGREDKATHRETINNVLAKYTRIVPDFPTNKVITSFTGVRAASYTEDFIIRFSPQVPNLLHVAGIQSPGLASAPAVAEYAVGLLRERWPNMAPKVDWKPTRTAPPEFARLSTEEQNALISRDHAYAHIICRCETVTEAEVRAACRGPLGATTVDGVKRRTRAGAGRCQGGFCSPYVAKILSEEHGIPLVQITKDGPGSELFVAETKEDDHANA